MCICINCFFYSDCNLNKKLENYTSNKKYYSYSPIKTKLILNIFNKDLKNDIFSSFEYDVIECESFIEKPYHWIKTKKRIKQKTFFSLIFK